MQKIVMQLVTNIWLIIFLILLSLVTYLLLIELPPKPQTIAYLDKIQHAFIFLLLTIFGVMACKPHGYLLAAALILYGALTELLQRLFTITRMASIGDWLADAVGVLIGLLVIVIFKKIVLTFKHKFSHERRI